MLLVERSLSSKHPQLMLRRTESIVEKMLTNWLALCLYDYMKDYAGSSLFVLFKAIKFQVGTECKYCSIKILMAREYCPVSNRSRYEPAGVGHSVFQVFKTLL